MVSTEIDGRPARVVFMDALGGNVVDEAEARVAVAVFDDGSHGFFLLQPDEQQLNDEALTEDDLWELTEDELDDLWELHRDRSSYSGGRYPSEEYVYHGTPRENLAAIKTHGLKPNAHGNPLNVHHVESSAAYYAGPEGALLRIQKSALPEGTTHDPLTSRSWTSGTIPPSAIEIKHEGEWKPLVEGK